MRKEIEILRNEVETALRSCLALNQFKRSLGCEECTEKINENIYFWMVFERSVQASMFIGLRRLFENENDTFNFQMMINLFRANIGEFSKSSLRQRKIEGSANASEWIDRYMDDAHEATEDDFCRLSRLAKSKNKQIKEISIKIASKVYAHAIHDDREISNELMSDLKISDVEDALNAIWHVYQQIWQMYENGRSPEMEIGKYPYEKEIVDAVSKQIGCTCLKTDA